MIRVWDGFLSAFCAVITLGVIGIPLWGAIQAVQAALIPGWSWVAIVALGLVGIVMLYAFARKAARGVHPLRDRRR